MFIFYNLFPDFASKKHCAPSNPLVDKISEPRQFANFKRYLLGQPDSNNILILGVNPKNLVDDENLKSENLEFLDFICGKFKIEKVWCAWGNLIDTAKFLRNCQQEIFSQLRNKNYKFIHYGALITKNNPRHSLYMSLKNNFADCKKICKDCN